MVPLSGDDAVSFDMLRESILRLEDKVDELSRKMSERDGERRVGAWMLCTVSAMLGSGVAFALEYFGKHVT